MTSHHIILYSFLCVISIIVFSGYLVKIYRFKREKNRVTEPQEARAIDIELKGDIFELDKLSIILEDLVRYNVPVKTILDLNIVLEEVYTSIVNQQKEGQDNKNVLISLVLDPGQIRVSITDHNAEFNPIVMQKIDLNAPFEEISFHGLGFHLVRHLADDLNYQRMEDRNILTMKKTYAK